MNNFTFVCPTKIVFGKGSIENLNNLISKNQKILIIFGGGSVKKNGVYDEVINSLQGYNLKEFWGIEPNPKFETCMEAVDLARKEKIDFLLSVGGGSVLDATKFIAAAIKFKGNEWDIVSKNEEIKEAIPLASVMTLPATGSEMNCISVISHAKFGLKLGWSNPLVFPKFSIIDPQTTFSLPIRQIRNGIVDTFVHTIEQYCTIELDTPVQDGFSFSIINTLLSNAKIALNSPNNYNAKANLFWAATCGLNGWNAVGVIQDWSSHAIGHELSVVYGMDHGQSLAIVLPKLLKYNLNYKKEKLVKLAKAVFKLSGDDSNIAEACIEEILNFFKSTGIATELKELGIDKYEAANIISKRFKERNLIVGEQMNINAQAVKEILSNY